jgi:hypothetical protein
MPIWTKPEPGMPCVIHVAERDFIVRFTLKVIKELHVNYEIRLLKPDSMMEALQDPEKFGVVLYHGLKSKQPDITLEWVEENIDSAMLIELSPALAYAVVGRTADQIPNVPKPEANPSTGSPSGQSGDMISGAVN